MFYLSLPSNFIIMRENYNKFYSHNLSGDFEYLVFGEKGGFPIVLFPTSMGRYFENKDFGLIESAKWFLENGLVQIYCPDSIDKHSWYNKKVHPAQKVQNHIWYDKMLNEELVPWILHETGRAKVGMAGCSFGGFHAANFAFRHPDKVSHLFCMSSAYDIKSFMDGYYNEDVYFNNIMDYLLGSNDPNLWQMSIVLGTSDLDICLKANLELSGLLHGKGINHWLDNRGQKKHDWPVWKEMFPHYLSLLK